MLKLNLISSFIKNYELTRWYRRLKKEDIENKNNKWSWDQLKQEESNGSDDNNEKRTISQAAMRKKKTAALRKELKDAKTKAIEIDKWRDNNALIKAEERKQADKAKAFTPHNHLQSLKEKISSSLVAELENNTHNTPSGIN